MANVNVLDRHGQLVSIDEANLAQGLAQKDFTLASPKDVADYFEAQKYEGVGPTLGAFAAGAARMGTFGLSDQLLTGLHIASPEYLRKNAERHNIATGLGEAAPLAASALLTGGAGAAAEGLAGEGAEAALAAGAKTAAGDAVEGATGLASKPWGLSDIALGGIRGGQKAGEAVGQWAVPNAAPAATTTAQRIAQQAMQTGIGSAVEGSFYGAGHAVSENALGDPDYQGEHFLVSAMRDAGLAGIIGGGLGAALGAGRGYFEKGAAMPDTAPITTPEQKAKIEAGDLKTIVDTAPIPEAEKEAMQKGLKNLKPNYKETESAAEIVGKAAGNDGPSPLMAGMVSADRKVQNFQDALIQGPPTFSAKGIQETANRVWTDATKAVDNALGGVDNVLSESQAGEQVAAQLGKRLGEERAFYDDAYSLIKEKYGEAVPVTQKAMKRVAGNLVREEEQYIRIEGNSLEKQFLLSAQESMGNLENLDDVKFLRQKYSAEGRTLQRNGEAAQARLRFRAADKLYDFEKAETERFLEANAKKVPEFEKMLGYKQTIDASYAETKPKYDRLMRGLGKKNSGGLANVEQAVDDINPQLLAKRVFAKGNTKFARQFAADFPEEFEIVKRYQIGQLREAGLAKDGTPNVRRLTSKINGLEPELKGLLFSPEQQEVIDAADHYVRQLPSDYNGSHTSHVIAIREFGHPQQAIHSNIRDAALSKYAEWASGLDPDALKAGKVVRRLSRIERGTQSVEGDIDAKVGEMFEPKAPGKQARPDKGARGASRLGNALSAIPRAGAAAGVDIWGAHKDTAHIVSEIASNPAKLYSALESSTKELTEAAPNISQSAQVALTRAAQYLGAKVPMDPNPGIFSGGYRPSASEIADFANTLAIIENPASVLSKAKRGTITPADTMTLKAVFPKIHEAMSQKVLDRMTTHIMQGKHVPYATRIGIGTLLGQDLDRSLAGPAVLSNQAAIQASAIKAAGQQAAAAGHGSRSTQGGLGKLARSSAIMTDAQKATQRIDRS